MKPLNAEKKPLLVVLTGASGIMYGVALVRALSRLDYPFYLIISKSARIVLEHETDISPGEIENLALDVFDENDLSAPVASGSFPLGGMIICPCSMKTLGLIANGIDTNLITRAASCQLKEGRKLVLVPRETPLSLPMVENMRKVILAGATLLPASPGFYHAPTSLEDIFNFVAGKCLDQFGIDHDLYKRWKWTPS